MTEPKRQLLTRADYEIEIRHSRFRVHAGRVDEISGTLDFFETVREPAANHNCWAWRIGGRYRFSDDGEPASTAGKPILAAIDGQGFDNTMVVVTRYFGGIKLGVGGLIRAYGGAAARCLQQAQSEIIVATRTGLLKIPFASTGTVHQLLRALDASTLAEKYTPEGVELKIRIAADRWQRLAGRLRDSTRGQARLRPLV